MFKPVVETNHLINFKLKMTKPQVNILDELRKFLRKSKAGVYYNMVNLSIDEKDFDPIIRNLVHSLERQDPVLISKRKYNEARQDARNESDLSRDW
jgi:hypothetical protein